MKANLLICTKPDIETIMEISDASYPQKISAASGNGFGQYLFLSRKIAVLCTALIYEISQLTMFASIYI